MIADPRQTEAFISSIVEMSLNAQRQADAQARALTAASGSAEVDGVRVRVGPGGVLTDIDLLRPVADYSPATLTHALRDGYRIAADRANQATAAAVIDDDARAQVLSSVPESVAERRVDHPVDDTDGPRVADAQGTFTVDDLPPDPDFEKVLAVLDAPDPMTALRELDSAGEFDMVDLTRPVEEIDAEIRAELEAISARAADVGPEVRAVQGQAENRSARATAGPWGALASIEVRPAGLDLPPAELVDDLLAAYRAAVADAAVRAKEILTDADLAEPTDPTVRDLDGKAQA